MRGEGKGRRGEGCHIGGQTMMNKKKTSKYEANIRFVNHMDTTTCTEIFQISLLNFASGMMLLCTLLWGPSAALLMGLDLTKLGMLPGWSTSLLR